MKCGKDKAKEAPITKHHTATAYRSTTVKFCAYKILAPGEGKWSASHSGSLYHPKKELLIPTT
jgi:hypothetical protein